MAKTEKDTLDKNSSGNAGNANPGAGPAGGQSGVGNGNGQSADAQGGVDVIASDEDLLAAASQPPADTQEEREGGPFGTVAQRRSVKVRGKTYGPGSEVPLPAEEIKALQESGFLVRPDEMPAAKLDGPTFSVSEGPSFQQS